MSSFRLIAASLLYHWRTNAAVACGVVAGTAVLTGALLVGDSMQGSLRHLTLDRLGPIDEVLLTQRFFRRELAEELADQPEFRQRFTAAVPAIILRASLENTDRQDKKRANRVNLIGCDSRFWRLWGPRPDRNPQPSGRQLVLNQPLAERLDVDVGDDVLLHVPDLGTVPGDSLLGKKRGTVKRPRLTVAAIIPARGPGRFSLRPDQRLPLSAYVSLRGLQGRLGRPSRANAILVAGKATDPSPRGRKVREARHKVLKRLLRPTPTDYGINVTENVPDLPTAECYDFGHINITSDRLLLELELEAAIRRALEGEEYQPVLTYLANAIDKQKRHVVVQEQGDDGRIIPYSTITAIDFARKRPLGPFRTPNGDPIEPLDDKDGKSIVLNSWAADDLGVQPGEKIYVTYFEPESTHGQAEERTDEFQLAAIVDLAGPAKDKALTPTVPGVTDKRSIDQWDAPFSPFRKKLIRKKDDAYWREYGLTPKAFVSLATGQRLWGSPRFGQTTGFRVTPDEETTVESLTERLRLQLKPDRLGFAFQPVKQQGLDASKGTTDFNFLFLGFSLFIIAAAVMLVALLFRLGIDRRAAQLGILVAVGFTRRRVALLLAGEGLLVAAVGSLVGVPAGIGYAALMLLGLQTWWREAVATPFLRLHLTPRSLVIGFASGLIVALLAIVWAVWRTRHTAPRQLLAGQATDESPLIKGRPRYAAKLATGLVIAAVAFGLLAARIGQEMQAGAFFGVGALVLVASLILLWTRLRGGGTGAAVAAGHGNLLRMALRNAARNPGRSTLTIGLVASACFLIVAVSAFRLDPTDQVPTLQSGNGGFALVAESDQPIYQDLNTPEGRAQLGFSPKDSRLLAETTTIALRAKPGDDASCLNLYRPRQPRVLGIPIEFIDRGGFAWAGSAATPGQNPWSLLEDDLGTATDGITPLVPVVIGKNTATYSLHLGFNALGKTYDVTDGRGQTIRLKVVGLLNGSIFQGDLLISEAALLRYFPEVSGYRFFLTEITPGQAAVAHVVGLLAAGIFQNHLLIGETALLQHFADVNSEQLLLTASAAEGTAAVRNALETALGDYGLAAETTGERLARFLAVQNTYLLTFQSLGGLGLLLGTFGLVAVQLRNVLERRGELALLRAAGFRRSALAAMVMLENGLLLSGGLASGVLAALVAVLPHLLTRAASIPWGPLAGTLAGVLAVGLIAGLAAVRAVLTAPLLAALREER